MVINSISNKKLNIKFSIDNLIVIFIFLATIIFSNAAAKGDSTLSSLNTKLILLNLGRGFILLSTIYFLFCKYKIGLKIILPFFLYFMSLFNVNETHPLFLISFVYFILFCNILALKKNQLFFLFTLYRNYIIIMSIMGLLGYFSFLLNFPIPYKIVDYYDDLHLSNYINYGFCYIYYFRSFIMRLCGLFSEPGAYGVVLALMLCIDNIKLRKISNLVLFVAGFFTFSIAFWVLLVIYIFFKNIKKTKSIVIFLLIIFVFFMTLYYLDNPVLNQAIFRRLAFENGKVLADNRLEESGNKFFNQTFILSEYIFWGHGGGFSRTITGGSSFKIMIMDYGIIGFFILNGFFILIALKQAGKNYYIYPFIICFFSLLYKSTLIINGDNLILLLGGIEYIKENYKIRNLER